MRALYVSVLAAISLTLGGCLQSTSLVKLNADGSGTIEQRTVMTTAALTSLRLLAGSFAKPGDKPIEPFSEADARRAADEIGEGVTFVSSEPVSAPDGEGRIAVYEFRDITKIHLNGAKRAAGSGGINAHDSLFSKDNTADFTIDFTHTQDGNALVTLHLSGRQMESMLKERGIDRQKEVKPSDLAMVKQMFAGMRMVVQVEPAGRVVRTNSPYVDGRTVTLFELDLDELLKNDALLPRLQRASTPNEISAALKEVRGLKMALDHDVTIEFTPAR